MIIKNSILGVFATSLLLGFNTVAAADCKFAIQETWVHDRNIVILYELSDEMLGALTAQGTTDIRLSTNQSDYDFNFGNKPTDRMQFVLGCVQS